MFYSWYSLHTLRKGIALNNWNPFQEKTPPMKVVERWYRSNNLPKTTIFSENIYTLIGKGDFYWKPWFLGNVRIFHIQESCHDAPIWTFVVDLRHSQPSTQARRMAKAKKFGVRNPWELDLPRFLDVNRDVPECCLFFRLKKYTDFERRVIAVSFTGLKRTTSSNWWGTYSVVWFSSRKFSRRVGCLRTHHFRDR